jgi:exonuclease SbcD
MRVLHTADWHLNDRLGAVHRNDDLVARLHQVARYLDEHAVDLMVVAGDVFSTYTRLAEIERAWTAVYEVFRPFLARGGTILALSGNHDSDPLFRFLRLATFLGGPFPVGRTDAGAYHPHPAGRLHVAADPTVFRLAEPDGSLVQVVALPYPTTARYLQGQAAHYASVDEKNDRLHAALLDQLHDLQAHHVDPAHPAVLAAHLHVRGSELDGHALYRLTERDDVCFEPGHLPTGWAYTALGHIHKRQKIGGQDHVRYSGGIDRMDFGEAEDDKAVVVFDVDAQGAHDVTWLPLDATPLHRLTVSATADGLDLETSDRSHPGVLGDAERAIVDLTVRFDPTEADRTSLLRQARALFPRAAWVRAESTAEPATADATPLPSGDPATVARDYVADQMTDDDPDEREATLALLDGLLSPAD